MTMDDVLEAARQLQALADELGFEIDLDRSIGEQSVGEQQRLELLRGWASTRAFSPAPRCDGGAGESTSPQFARSG